MAFTSNSLLPRRVRSRSHRTPACSLAKNDDYTGSSAYEAVALMTRRTFMSALGSITGLSVAAHIEAVEFATSTAVDVLRAARSSVDMADDYITDAKWDAVRTLLSSRPVSGVKEACRKIADSAPSDMKGAVVGLKEDVLSQMRLLDTAVYSNVFIGEDRQILGTKIDYDTPRTYLADLKNSLDELIQLVGDV